jgi:hypothetical protein
VTVPGTAAQTANPFARNLQTRQPGSEPTGVSEQKFGKNREHWRIAVLRLRVIINDIACRWITGELADVRAGSRPCL